jgi:hypothetical protein
MLVGQPEDGIPLQLRNPEIPGCALAERPEELREDLPRVLELGGRDELGVSGDVAEDDQSALHCHRSDYPRGPSRAGLFR